MKEHVLGDFLHLSRDPVHVSNPANALLISVRLHGQGAVRRTVGDGKAPKPFIGNRGRTGQFVFSRIWARRGAMALIPDDLDGVVVTNEFPLFDLNTSLVLPEYLNRLVQSANFLGQLELISAGASGQNRVKEAAFLQIKVLLPALIEQQRIAAILDQADALRAERRRVFASLQALTQSMFLQTFGDPLRNPRRWPMSNLGSEASSMQYGPRFYNESYAADGVRIVRITDLDQAGNLSFDTMPRMAVSKTDVSKFGLAPGDIVFARTGATVGKLAVIKRQDPICIAGAYFIRIVLNDRVLPIYVASALRTRSIQSIVWARSHQSAQQNFSGPGLRALPLPVPPMKEQVAFERRVDQLDEYSRVALGAMAADDELFASLQFRAFRGEL